MYNPFDIESEITAKDIVIEIWLEVCGRKKNTYLSGWDLSDQELKTHIKTIKKKNGCNGTLKIYNDRKVLQFQGDIINYLNIYIKENINYNYIVKIRSI